MANYIDKLILSESYIYIADYELTSDAEAKIRRMLEASIRLRSPYFFQADVNYELKVESGSLTIKCTILGSLAAFLLSSANFREAVDQAYESSKYFSRSIVVDGIVASERPMYRVDAKEARLGVPGRLKRLIIKLAGLSTFSANWKSEHLKKELIALNKEIKNIYDDIGDSHERKLISDGLMTILNQDFPKILATAPSAQEFKNFEIRNNTLFADTINIVLDGKTPERKSLEIDWKLISSLFIALSSLYLHFRKGGDKNQSVTSDGSFSGLNNVSTEALAASISVKQVTALKKIAEEEKAKMENLAKDDFKNRFI